MSCSPDTGDSDTGTCNVVQHKYNNAQFITAVNSQNTYNKGGIVRAIPIIVYHIIVNYPDLSDSNRAIDTTLNLFDAEMRYLYVLKIAKLCNPADTEKDINRLISIHQKYRKTGREYN
ncbi:MAG: hypothetical protein ACJ71X_09475 [Nitrososphaeraceae archaeon]